MMRGAFLALLTALAVFASSAAQTGYAGVADYWVGTHAGVGSSRVGDRWDGGDDPAEYPATSVWDTTTAATSEFGAGHAYCSSSLSDGNYFVYNYADGTWFDEIVVYDDTQPFGTELEVYLHFELDGGLGVTQCGTRPADTRTEGRAAVSATVESKDLGVIAHGYNMWSSSSFAGDIMRKSGNWDLGGALDPDGSGWLYDNALTLALTVPNGVYFDLMAAISVGSSASLAYTGQGTFGGLDGYCIDSTADFRHSMVLGGFTDRSGTDVRHLGYMVWSSGPSFGGPRVIPEPTGIVLAMIGLAALAGFRTLRRRK